MLLLHCGDSGSKGRTLSRHTALTLTALLSGFYNHHTADGRRGKQKAEVCFNKMVKVRVTRNGKTYGILINACTHKSDIQKAEVWFNMMVKAWVQPDAVTYSSLIKACAQKGHVHQAEVWFDELANALLAQHPTSGGIRG